MPKQLTHLMNLLRGIILCFGSLYLDLSVSTSLIANKKYTRSFKVAKTGSKYSLICLFVCFEPHFRHTISSPPEYIVFILFQICRQQFGINPQMLLSPSNIQINPPTATTTISPHNAYQTPAML